MQRLWVALLLLVPLAAAADGKIYASDIFPEIPDQRALILHDGESQVFLLQSRFAAPAGKQIAEFGWVVPVPSEPELATTSAANANILFHQLARWSAPAEVSILPLAMLLALGVVILGLGARIAARVPATARGARRFLDRPQRATLEQAAVLGLIGGLLAAVSLSAYGPGVEIVKELQVGAYDAKVVRAKASGELLSWFKQNRFAFSESDAPVLDAYIRRGWFFVTAKIASKRDQDFGTRGMSPPLLIRFGSPQIVYPLALTATAGRATDLALYVIAASQVDAGGRLPLSYAGNASADTIKLRLSQDNVSPPDFANAFKSERADYLTKFKGRLEAEQMHDDLVLAPSAQARLYRGTVLGPLSIAVGGGSLVVALLAWCARLTRRPYLESLSPLHYLLVSLFLTPLLGLLLLTGNGIEQFLKWRKSQRASRVA